MPGVSLQPAKEKNYCFGAAGAGAGAGAGRFMLGAPLSIAGGDAGLLPWPVVTGGLVESEAMWFASRPLLNAKINTRATTAKPAIHPHVERDQASESTGALTSGYAGRAGSR